jgi:uncharacterized membrane protein
LNNCEGGEIVVVTTPTKEIRIPTGPATIAKFVDALAMSKAILLGSLAAP